MCLWCVLPKCIGSAGVSYVQPATCPTLKSVNPERVAFSNRSGCGSRGNSAPRACSRRRNPPVSASSMRTTARLLMTAHVNACDGVHADEAELSVVVVVVMVAVGAGTAADRHFHPFLPPAPAPAPYTPPPAHNLLASDGGIRVFGQLRSLAIQLAEDCAALLQPGFLYFLLIPRLTNECLSSKPKLATPVAHLQRLDRQDKMSGRNRTAGPLFREAAAQEPTHGMTYFLHHVSMDLCRVLTVLCWRISARVQSLGRFASARHTCKARMTVERSRKVSVPNFGGSQATAKRPGI